MKAFFKISAILALVLIAAVAYCLWRTSIYISPQSPYEAGPTFSFQTDNFLIDIPDSFQLISFTGLVEWPDGFSFQFQEFFDNEGLSKSIIEDFETIGKNEFIWGGKAYNLSQELGRPSKFISYSREGRAQAGLTIFVKYHNGFVVFSAKDDSSLDKDENNNELSEREALFILNVKEFLERYFWVGEAQGIPEIGMYKCRLGLIRKNGSERFYHWPLKAIFWSNKFRQSFEIHTSASGGEANALCSQNSLNRLRQQGAYRTNCQRLELDGVEGFELLNLKAKNFDGNHYNLLWEADFKNNYGTRPRIYFRLGPPLSKVDANGETQPPKKILARWLTLLNSVHFF